MKENETPVTGSAPLEADVKETIDMDEFAFEEIEETDSISAAADEKFAQRFPDWDLVPPSRATIDRLLREAEKIKKARKQAADALS